MQYINKKARFNYEIIETFEAGMVLQGNEVKSVRDGKLHFGDAFVTVKDGEVFLHNLNIDPYDKSHAWQPDPSRTRKLLLKKREIRRLIGKSKEKGLAIIPLKLFFHRQFVKCQIGLGKGKKTLDKRQTIKDRMIKRDMDRSLKGIG